MSILYYFGVFLRKHEVYENTVTQVLLIGNVILVTFSNYTTVEARLSIMMVTGESVLIIFIMKKYLPKEFVAPTVAIAGVLICLLVILSGIVKYYVPYQFI